MPMSKTLFERIIAREIPAKIEHEDERCIVIHDIQPQAPVHLLIIPKAHIVSLAEVDASHEALLGRMLTLAPRLAREQGASNGFRTVINTGPDGGQEVYHLHLHAMGGPRPWKHG